jgi:stress response protein YsnF
VNSEEEEGINNRKETTSTSATTAATGNTKEEELTSVNKPETTVINKEIMVITPPLIKYSNVVVVRPSSQEKRGEEDDSISDEAKDASKSLKQTVSTVGENAKLGNNNDIEKDKIVNKIEHSYKQLDNEGSNGQNTAAIPVNEERFSISKNTVIEDVKIEKRWITTTKKVEIPVPYEQVYVNDKLIKLFDEKYDDSILSKLKGKILDSIDRGDKNKQQHTISQQENQPRGELIPLFDDKDENNNNNNNQETEKVIPILGEEIVVSRRTVKIGEIVIKKRRVTDNKKIKIDIKKEKVMLKYPDGTTEQITA